MKKFISILSLLFCAASFAGDNTARSISDFERSVEQFFASRYQDVMDAAENGTEQVVYITKQGVFPYHEYKLIEQAGNARKEMRSLQQQIALLQESYEQAHDLFDDAQSQLTEIRQDKQLKKQERAQLEQTSALLIQKMWKNHQQYKAAKAQLDALRIAHEQGLVELDQVDCVGAQETDASESMSQLQQVKKKSKKAKAKAKKQKQAALFAKKDADDEFLNEQTLKVAAEKAELDRQSILSSGTTNETIDSPVEQILSVKDWEAAVIAQYNNKVVGKLVVKMSQSFGLLFGVRGHYDDAEAVKDITSAMKEIECAVNIIKTQVGEETGIEFYDVMRDVEYAIFQITDENILDEYEKAGVDKQLLKKFDRLLGEMMPM